MRIIILGPTASGKSNLAFNLARSIECPIISADSRQCYKYLDIGTAKPSPEMMKLVPHYNISILEPEEEDSAVSFQKRAQNWEKEIAENFDHIIYAGGSTLHLQGIIQPFDPLPDSNEKNLHELEAKIEKNGLQALFDQLNVVDPEYATSMDGLNRQRILRALDVWMQTGKPFSSFHHTEEISADESTLVYGLKWDRDKLYQRINARTEEMINAGLVEEAQKILASGYSPELQSLNTVGYKEIFRYLNGEWPIEKAIEKIKTHTRRYAKRQITWFKRWEFIQWLEAEDKTSKELAEIIQTDLAAKSDKG